MIFLLAACSSTSQKPEKTEAFPFVETERPPEGDGRNIDYEKVQQSLGLSREIYDLGYEEKSFDTCTMGYGYLYNKDCRTEYFTVIHFQLLCRDSQGTISTALSREDMRPLSGRTVNWTVAGSNGNVRLDSDGYGQIKTTFKKSPRYQRLKLNVDNENLYLKSGEIKRIVTPSNWCNR